jgi:UDP-4-amino-4-deoxy-L-arabinose-oxoglutarate aminotransferase
MKIEFYKHDISRVDIANLNKVLKGVFLTTGETVADFEKKLAVFLDAKHVVGLMSGTAALHLSLAYFGIGPGDEVITTPLTYTATLDAIEYLGAKPILVDVEVKTGNMNAELIKNKITKKTKAILPVHLYGQMCDMRKIRKIADKFGLKIIEDSAHCLEGERDGVRPAQLGDIACFSFYATKNITCGEGGAIATNIADAGEWFKKARSHGLNKDVSARYGKTYAHYDKEFLGFKCNMSNIQAALMLDQLKRIRRQLKIRERICQTYNQSFSKIENINLLELVADTVSTRYLYTILVDKDRRDDIMQQLRQQGIHTVVNYRPAHLLSYYRKKYGLKEGDFPVAEDIGSRTLSLPLYPKLTGREIKYIIETLIKTVS